VLRVLAPALNRCGEAAKRIGSGTTAVAERSTIASNAASEHPNGFLSEDRVHADGS
jgi:hypothetical protein